MDFTELKNIIDQNKTFVISSHVNPDADALGSELAMYFILKKLGKTISVINHSPTPYNLNFLDKDNVIEKYNSTKHDEIIKNAGVLFALDLNQSNRMVSMENAFNSGVGTKVCIDHHQDRGDFADYFFIDTESSATGELIYNFIEQTNIVEFDYDIALQIYAAIMTDTGSFKYERTTPRVHRIAAHLLELGVSSVYVFDQIHDQSRFARIKLLGMALNTIESDNSGQVTSMVITQQMLKETGAVEADVEGFVNFCLAIKNVKIGLLFYELKDGVKISFRSKGSIPVNKLAAEYNGGGHVNASGTRLFDVELDDLKEKVIKSAEKYLERE